MSEKYGFDQGFDWYEGKNGLKAEEINNRALAWIQKNKNKKFFVFLHYFDLHQPYNAIRPDAEKNTYGYTNNRKYAFEQFRMIQTNKVISKYGYDISSVNQNLEPGKYVNQVKDVIRNNGGSPSIENEFENHFALKGFTLSEDEKAEIIGMYDDGISAVDYWLEQLFEKLDQWDLLDDAVVIITSDHGEMLYDHRDHLGHTRYLYGSVINIPLIIKLPHQKKGQRIKSFVSSVDIAPTILDYLDVPKVSNFQGHSLIPLIKGDQHYIASFILSELSNRIGPQAMIQYPWEYIRKSADEPDELYNIEKDKGEKNDLINNYPETAKKMGKNLLEFIKNNDVISANTSREKVKLEQEEIDDLRALGYVN